MKGNAAAVQTRLATGPAVFAEEKRVDMAIESGTSEQPKLARSATTSSGEVSLSIPVPTKIAAMPAETSTATAA